MKMRRLSSITASVVLAGSAVMAVASPMAAASTITQAYSCTIPIIGTESASVQITGTATLSGTTITMSKVVFSVTNPTSDTITADKIVITVPEPNATSAPYKTGTAKVAKTPPGWKASGNSKGVSAKHAGSLTVQGGGTISNAALSAKYADKGPKGTVISFKPGKVTFDLTSPISGSVSCTPTAPVAAFATVTE